MAYKEMSLSRVAKIARNYPRSIIGEAPISLHVALCDACFNRCIMCEHPLRKQHTMPLIEWIGKLREFAHMGVESVCYAGGDAMAYRNFNDVMMEHISLGMKFGMTTSGYVPHYIDLDLLKYAEWVRVSLDAVEPEVYAKVRGKTPVEKVKTSIEAMMAADVNVEFGITVHADNAADLPNVLAYAASIGVTEIETHHIVPGGHAIKGVGWERKIEPFQRCHAALYQLYIDAQGDVYPCCMTAGDAMKEPQAHSLGNVFRGNWHTIWQAAIDFSKLNVKQLPEICRTCTQRLSQINTVCDEIVKLSPKSFF